MTGWFWFLSHRMRATRGQIVIFIAVGAVAMVGMIGLAVDLGYSFAQKRATQNAADAAAVAGTRDVTRWSTTNTTVTAMSDATSMAHDNKMGNATQTVRCYYVDDSDTKLATCDQPVPQTATGVTVEVSETHPTFFMQVVPGAPKTVTTRAYATAHAQKVDVSTGNAPFIMCGANAKLASGHGSMSILIKNGDSYELNPNAINQSFEVHGSQIDDCGLPSSSYKGLADQSLNDGKSVGTWYNGSEGVAEGRANELVRGVQGCQPTTQAPYNCVMFVPLATDNPPPYKDGDLRMFYVVGYAAFEVSSCSSPCQHQATLLGKYIVETPSGLPSWTPGSWARGDDGIIAIRLTR